MESIIYTYVSGPTNYSSILQTLQNLIPRLHDDKPPLLEMDLVKILN